MFSQYRFNKKLDRVLNKMDEERNKPNFRNGNLDYILESSFPKLNRELKNKIIKSLEDIKEIGVGPFGDYVFYKGKIPDKNWRNFNPYK